MALCGAAAGLALLQLIGTQADPATAQACLFAVNATANPITVLDKNGDGKIGADEMPRRPQGGMPPLSQVDANKDGKIVFEEFRNLSFVTRLPEDRQRALARRSRRGRKSFRASRRRMNVWRLRSA